MEVHNFSIWTGPTCVERLADKITEAGIVVTARGTERVYVAQEGACRTDAALQIEGALRRVHGTTFGLQIR